MPLHPRRKFLKTFLSAGIFSLVYNPFKKLFGSTTTNAQLWAELIEYARWCPSVHNMQPHRVKIISATEAELYYDPSRLLPVGDPDSRFATVAMGIFIEHLSVAAASEGLVVAITHIFEPITTQSKKITRLANLKLVPALKHEPLDKTLITKRKTSRLHYNGVALQSHTLNLMKAQAEIFGHEFFYSSDTEKIKAVIQMNQQTLFADLASDADRKELDHLFRYSKEEASLKKDGLWAKCMGFSGKLVKSVFTHHKRWEKGLRKKILAAYYKQSFTGTATVCWLGGPFENTTDWLQAGRMLARNWMLITKEGAYLHPLGSLITNQEAYKHINEKFTQPSAGKKIWMIFRAGYSKEPERSFRLDTKDIILN
jgi:hypothetical protein